MDTLILQPNVGEYNLRRFLVGNGFDISKEELVFENNKFYEIIKAVRTDSKLNYSDEELFFGPILLREKSELMFEKYKGYLESVKKNLEVIPENHPNYERFKTERDYIINFLGE